MCLGKLVTSFSVPEDGGKANQNQAFLYATGIIVCMLFYCLIWHWYIERVTQTGIRMRVAVSSLLYKKVKFSSKFEIKIRFGLVNVTHFIFLGSRT